MAHFAKQHHKHKTTRVLFVLGIYSRFLHTHLNTFIQVKEAQQHIKIYIYLQIGTGIFQICLVKCKDTRKKLDTLDSKAIIVVLLVNRL